MSEIAKKLNPDRSIISRELKRHEISLRSPSAVRKLVVSKNKIKKSVITKLYYKDRLTQKQIEKRLNVHKETRPSIISVKKGYKKSDGGGYRNTEWRFNVNTKSSLLSLLQLLKPRLKHRKRLRDLKKTEQNIIDLNQGCVLKTNSLKYLPV